MGYKIDFLMKVFHGGTKYVDKRNKKFAYKTCIQKFSKRLSVLITRFEKMAFNT